jgi:hypothetical protein
MSGSRNRQLTICPCPASGSFANSEINSAIFLPSAKLRGSMTALPLLIYNTISNE